eukprot:TRINITY_DN2560_c0_g1_i1.p1 TRINITY_DN2560_c0_g1~~TRINITY_DN2560_c0_g1_i1.p1  ORF type:complete len:152 (-),score=37.15 TRINITY_DN2560_c0_g1_i1:200-610(-)
MGSLVLDSHLETSLLSSRPRPGGSRGCERLDLYQVIPIKSLSNWISELSSMASLFLSSTLMLPMVLAQSDYCAISSQHTMCQYKGAGPACNGQPLARGVSKQEIQQILDVHNRYRSLIARGKKEGAVQDLNHPHRI